MRYGDWVYPLVAWGLREAAGLVKRRLEKRYGSSLLDLAERYLGFLIRPFV